MFGSGKAWTEQRRFAIRNLRDLGLGRTSMEGLITEEVKELIEWIKLQNGQPITLHRKFEIAVINALWTILSGTRFEHGDPHLAEILDNCDLYVTEDQYLLPNIVLYAQYNIKPS